MKWINDHKTFRVLISNIRYTVTIHTLAIQISSSSWIRRKRVCRSNIHCTKIRENGTHIATMIAGSCRGGAPQWLRGNCISALLLVSVLGHGCHRRQRWWHIGELNQIWEELLRPGISYAAGQNGVTVQIDRVQKANALCAAESQEQEVENQNFCRVMEPIKCVVRNLEVYIIFSIFV